MGCEIHSQLVMLTTATYDELSREIEARLNTGLFDTLGLYSTEQQNYCAMWNEVMGELNELCLADFKRWDPLRQKMCDAMARHGGNHVQAMRKVYGVNTTFNGRVAEEDHRP